MPTLKVKTVYIEKLKDLGCYDSWLDNLKKQWKDIYTVRPQTFEHLVAISFDWSKTTEGDVYWFEISQK